jgi:uncharacterized integral membrane protein (TIGR00697 family)
VKTFRFADLCLGAFVTFLLCSNLIGAGKVAHWKGVTFSGAVFLFPFSYILGDVLTEVYGYAMARRAVWLGFFAQGFAAAVCWLVLLLPPAPGWPHQSAFETVFAQAPRITFASLTAFWVGEFLNSYVLAKLKIRTQGRHLWLRTVGSTVVGEGADSLIFYPLAFYGVWPNELLFSVMATNYGIKVLWEAACTPLTYAVIQRLKRVEKSDPFDFQTRFNPFSLEVRSGS